MTKFVAYNKSAYTLIKSFFKESYIFVIFWFLNGFIPIAICMISSSIPNDGAYYVIGIGYVTAFQLAYVQIGWTVSIALTYTILQMKFNKCDKIEGQSQGDLMFATVIITLIYGLVLVPLFIGPTYVYSKYANNHVNTVISQQSAYNYIYTLSGYIFLSPFISLMIIYIHSYKGHKASIPVIILSNGLIVGLSAILTLTPDASNNTKAIGTGLGMTIGALITAVALGLYVFFSTELRYSSFKLRWNEIRFILKQTFKQAGTILSIQIFKAIALIALGIVISDTMDSVVPMGYQFSRVVWYNYLYLIPFFAYGIADAMIFFGLRKKIEIRYRQMFLAFITIIAMSLLIEIGIAIGLRWTVEPLCNLYTRNSQLDWSTIDLNRVNLPFMLNKLADKFNINHEYVNQLVTWFEMDPVGTASFQEFLKISIVDVLSRNNMNGEALSQILLYPHARAYIFISVYGVFYSCSNILNNTSLVMKHRYQDAKESILLLIVQAVVITSIVVMGIEVQESKAFPLLDAWSFPLFVVGIAAILYYSLIFAKTAIEIEKAYADHPNSYITLNDNSNKKKKTPDVMIVNLNDETAFISEKVSQPVIEFD